MVGERQHRDEETALNEGALQRYACALHEVSNALTVVLGWLQQAGRGGTPDEVQRAIEVAREHAQRGQVLARRAIGSAVESRRSGRTARAVATFASVSVRPQAEAKGVHLALHADPGTDALVEGEPSLLQVLTNLLLNAIAFSPEGATIALDLARETEFIRFAVQDEGPGVPDEVRSKLFVERKSMRPGGAGIGLPYSRQLAAEHGGELRLVTSDHGARFELLWPLGPTRPPRHNLSGPQTSALASARILLIEDDPAVTALIELTLEARGSEVISVSSQADLRGLLQRHPIVDVILMDLSPLEDPIHEVLAEIAMVCPDAAIVLMSGQPGGVPEGAQGRFRAWMRKPFDMSELVQTVADLVAQVRSDEPPPVVIRPLDPLPKLP